MARTPGLAVYATLGALTILSVAGVATATFLASNCSDMGCLVTAVWSGFAGLAAALIIIPLVAPRFGLSRQEGFFVAGGTLAVAGAVFLTLAS